MTTSHHRAAVTGAVLLVLGLAVVGIRLGHELSRAFATPTCPYAPGQPQCMALGYTNGTGYYVAWHFGGAVAVSLAGVGLLSLGRRFRQTGAHRDGTLLVIPVVALTVALAVSCFVFVKMVAYQFLTADQSYFCGQLDCDEITYTPPRSDFSAWGMGGAVAGVLLALVLVWLGRDIRPEVRSWPSPTGL